MLQKLRNYVTPMVATIAIALLGATALAVSPQIVERLADDPVSEVIDGQGAPNVNETTDVIDGVGDRDLDADELRELLKQESEVEEAVTPTVTPTVEPEDDGFNHGHYVSCVAHMAKNDPTLARGQKGAVVSAAAKQDVEMAKGADCSVAYGLVKAAALGETQKGSGQGRAAASLKSAEQAEEQKQTSGGGPNAGASKNSHQVHHEGPAGPPAAQAGHPSSNGRGNGPKK